MADQGVCQVRDRVPGQGGFTLVELLVVILIMGILSAVALPAFLGQIDRGRDSDAKSSARNLVTHVESCWLVERDYRECNDPSELDGTGLPVAAAGSTPPEGEVAVAAATDGGFLVRAKSKSGNVFEIVKESAGDDFIRSCSTAGDAGCPSNGMW